MKSITLSFYYFIASVSAQVKSIPDGQSKMIRTQGVVSGNVKCEMQDQSSNIWFSTGGEGV